jgi:hypothetical protein
MTIGGYTLDLYCENYLDQGLDGLHEFNEFPKQYVNELGITCRKRAKKDGWVLHRDGRAYCPKCVKAGKFK